MLTATRPGDDDARRILRRGRAAARLPLGVRGLARRLTGSRICDRRGNAVGERFRVADRGAAAWARTVSSALASRSSRRASASEAARLISRSRFSAGQRAEFPPNVSSTFSKAVSSASLFSLVIILRSTCRAPPLPVSSYSPSGSSCRHSSFNAALSERRARASSDSTASSDIPSASPTSIWLKPS